MKCWVCRQYGPPVDGRPCPNPGCGEVRSGPTDEDYATAALGTDEWDRRGKDRSVLLAFDYTNHRGDSHRYVIEPEKIECGPYDQGGLNEQLERWVLHGKVITRDGDRRAELGQQRRRTFQMDGLRNIENVT